MANEIKKNNKTIKESKSDQTAHDRGVGSTALLDVFNLPFLMTIKSEPCLKLFFSEYCLDLLQLYSFG